MMAAGKYLGIQLGKITCHRHGNPVVAAEVGHFAFYAALLMAFAGCAELSLILPVRTEGAETRRQLALSAAHNLLHRTRKFVRAKPAEPAAKVMDPQFVPSQKPLRRGSQI